MTQHQRGSRQGVRNFIPRLETLEGRALPAGVSQIGSIVYVVGTVGPDRVQITDDGGGSPGSVRVAFNGRGFSSVRPVTEVRVRTVAGADTIAYTQTAVMRMSRRLDVDAGDGADAVAVSLAGGTQTGVFEDIAVVGNAGNDTITLSAPNVNVAPGSWLRWFLQGLDDADHISSSYSGRVDGQLLTLAEGNHGADVETAVYAIRAGSTGFVAAHMTGGTNFDHMLLLVRKQGPSAATIDARADGEDLLDWLTRTPNVQSANNEFVTTVL